jgi:hypothetical protein
MAASRRRPRSAPKPSTGTHLADRMPLSHFPAGTRFTNWQRWSALASAQARGVVAVQPTRHAGFKQLEDTHVFFFAGPCAYTRSGPLGDAAMWMHPDVERGATGGASPFDTGALETGRLRPWHTTGPGQPLERAHASGAHPRRLARRVCGMARRGLCPIRGPTLIPRGGGARPVTPTRGTILTACSRRTARAIRAVPIGARGRGRSASPTL